MLRSVLKDVGKIFIVAVVLDTIYQLMVLKAFYLGELLVVVMASRHPAVSRGPQRRFLLMRRIYRKHPKAAGQPATNPKRLIARHDTDRLITDHQPGGKQMSDKS